MRAKNTFSPSEIAGGFLHRGPRTAAAPKSAEAGASKCPGLVRLLGLSRPYCAVRLAATL